MPAPASTLAAICSFALVLAVTACDRVPEADVATRPTGQPSLPIEAASYVGSRACGECHADALQLWQGSHHQLAMAAPSPDSVLAPFDGGGLDRAGVETRFESREGRFIVTTDGPDGERAEFPVRYTFGVEPLQQYLLELPGGRLQALGVSWDSRPDGSWFHLYPDAEIAAGDVQHWTAPSQNWNHMCADCHSTAVRKRYDPVADAFATTFEEISVGCEACHGPGSTHLAEARSGAVTTALPDLSEQVLQIDSCAPCHSRRSQFAEGFAPPDAYLNHYLPALLDEGLYHADGQILDEVYVWGSFLQSRMHAAGVRCTDCHDPHTAGVRLQGNALCTQCHNETRRADFPTLTPARYDDVAHHFHLQGSEGGQCVSCHMTASTYMVIDDRRDHSFRLPRPDLAAVTGAPDACTGCHAGRDPAWAAGEIARRFGGERRRHYGEVLAAARSADPAVEAALAEVADDASAPAIVRATALALMVGYGRGETAAAIERGLRATNPLVRMGAVRGGARFEPQRRWHLLAPLLDDETAAVRIEGVRALLDVRGALSPAQRARLDAAIEGYLEQLRLVADRAEGQSNIATAALALGRVEAAEAALDRALDLNPDWVPALVNLADLYRATGRDFLAGDLLAAAAALAHEAPDVLVAQALWLVRQQRTPEALPLLRTAHELETGNGRLAYLYAVALNSSGEALAALDVIDACLRTRPEDRQLLGLAVGIARDAGLVARQRRYQARLASAS